MNTETKTYWMQGGDSTKIYISVVVTNPAEQQVAISNPPQPGDVEITEAQYNSYAHTNLSDSQAASSAIVAQNIVDKEALRDKLVTQFAANGFTLTTDEINLWLGLVS